VAVCSRKVTPPVWLTCAGLAYTTFTYALHQPPVTADIGLAHAYLAAHPEHGSRFAPLRSPVAAGYWVNVTNTGTVDSGANQAGVGRCGEGGGGGGAHPPPPPALTGADATLRCQLLGLAALQARPMQCVR
jgi:hypothetical protein